MTSAAYEQRLAWAAMGRAALACKRDYLRALSRPPPTAAWQPIEHVEHVELVDQSREAQMARTLALLAELERRYLS
jgi:hypothetical protein